jgi:hypothetical protein
VLRTHSLILAEDIICLEDDETADAGAGLVTYTRTELMRLRGLAPDVIRKVHSIKKAFGGRYVGPSAPSR